jgi:hypothetical protein
MFFPGIAANKAIRLVCVSRQLSCNYCWQLFYPKKIRFDHITDCSIVIADDSTCVWIPNTMNQVNIGTSNGSKCSYDLNGLLDPNGFQKLVLAMKRQQPQGTAAGVAASQLMDRGEGDNNNSTSKALLLEIRDELRQHNQRLMALE